MSRVPRERGQPPDAVWARVDRSGGPDACWPFMGARNYQGYGQISVFGRQIQAHRAAFMAWNGPTMYGIGRLDVVMHSCDNPPCCNPAHLSLGTHQSNVDDMRAKGRAKEHTQGSEHGTYGGYMRHAQARGGWSMPACQPCRDANTEYHRERARKRAEANPDPQPTDSASSDNGTEAHQPTDGPEGRV